MKSGNRLLESQNENSSTDSTISELWTEIWSVKALHKMFNVLWRLLPSCIPIKSTLRQRNILWLMIVSCFVLYNGKSLTCFWQLRVCEKMLENFMFRLDHGSRKGRLGLILGKALLQRRVKGIWKHRNKLVWEYKNKTAKDMNF